MSSVKALARIDVRLRPDISDPQGQTVERSLPDLGWSNVSAVRMGKHFELTLEGDSMDALRDQVDEMCRKFLTNPTLETFDFTLEPA